jgi:hypothetical protein
MLSLALALLLHPQSDAAEMAGEVNRLRGRVAYLESQLAQRDEALGGIRAELRALAKAIAEATPPSPAAPIAAAFLAGAPPSSDLVGVAKVAVFDPRIDVDSARRHDLVTLRVRRLESLGSKSGGELELGTDVDGLDLPLDQNGALYVVDWSTSEGHTYALVLRDGATGLPAATVQVKPQQHEGRFIFVGYRTE